MCSQTHERCLILSVCASLCIYIVKNYVFLQKKLDKFCPVFLLSYAFFNYFFFLFQLLLTL